MMFLFVAAFFLLVSGIFILCRISPFELYSQVAGTIHSRRKVKFKQAVKQSIKPKKIRGIKRIVKETQDTLQQENQSSRFPQLIMASFILSIVGVLLASAANNLILAPVLAIGLALIPFLYVLFMSARNRKNLNNALETGLSVITSTYLRTDSIITAVAENVDQLDPQIRPAFQRFLIQANLISPDIPLLLEGMKERIDSSVFHEWIDAMKLCQDDRNLKSTLLPIVNKLSDMRVVAGELNSLMYDPLKNFAILALALIAEIPIIRLMNVQWYDLLMFTVAGKTVIAVDAVILIVSLVAVIRNTRPVEYRR